MKTLQELRESINASEDLTTLLDNFKQDSEGVDKKVFNYTLMSLEEFVLVKATDKLEKIIDSEVVIDTKFLPQDDDSSSELEDFKKIDFMKAMKSQKSKIINVPIKLQNDLVEFTIKQIKYHQLKEKNWSNAVDKASEDLYKKIKKYYIR